MERYSSCVYHEDQFIWATAAELGEDAIDLQKIPLCSEQELAHPKCPVVKPRMDAPIRWVKGLSLHSGREVWVPAVMTYLHIPPMSPGERFWLPISTGCAASSHSGKRLFV
ncbi:YcaO-like family protein [Kroppenstedtia pulmonis]|uniref:YcaO-like family protein n=1 Tax=Kroppenstedtia pulmonis TaxID=1380685 RepID=UPI001FE5EAAA|nr:YcaO-like family protein [Kroppenstedtia pulmonis]